MRSRVGRMVRGWGAAMVVLGLGAGALAAGPEIKPTEPASLRVVVGAGTVTLPDGTSRTVAGARLTVAGPELRAFDAEYKAPGDYAPFFDSWDPWPGQGPKKEPQALMLTPGKDEAGTLILGGLYQALVRETLRVTSADGKTTYKMDEDFKLHPHWPQIAGLGGRLGTPGQTVLRIAGQYATQRLDLVQMAASGEEVTIKRGAASLVCPVLPAADAGQTALAGLYIAPWKTGGEYVIRAEDIFPIHPAAPVEPINPKTLAPIVAKLAAGQEVRIAFLGDSITLGAEAGPWWDGLWTEKNLGYPSRLVTALRARFPKATITPIAAFQGGVGTKGAAPFFVEKVVPQKPDVVIMALGLNDANGPVGKGPNNPSEKYKADMRAFIIKAKEAGAAVVLVTPMAPQPKLANGMAARVPAYRQALLELAKEEDVACADVYTEWQNQAARGIPPFSQLHNGINHPGTAGHALYADVLLRMFPVAGAAAGAGPAGGAAAVAPAAAVQPTTLPGKFEFRPVPLPDLAPVLQAAQNNPRIYGLYTWVGEYREHRDSIRKVGWKSFRVGGPFDDTAMQMFAEDGVEVMHTIGRAADAVHKAGVSAEEDRAFVAEYVGSILKFLERYGPNGSFFKEHPQVPYRPILALELWNEPNFQYLIPPDKRPQSALEAAREALYAKILLAVYPAVKARFKDVQVVGFAAGGASAGDLRFVQHVHEAAPAIAQSYDILSTHPYVDPAPPEAYSIRAWGSYSIASSLATLRQTLGAHQRTAPIWYTEIGWPISKADGGFFENKPREGMVSPLLQAAYVCRLYAFSQRLGVDRVHIMFATDTDNFNAGFFLRDGMWRPAAHAVATMIRMLPEPKLLAAISDGADGYFAYRLAPSADAKAAPVIMAWNVLGPKTVSLPTSGAAVTVTDMLGQTRTVAAQNGKVKVEVGPLPVYVVPN